MPVRRGQWASRVSESETRWSREKRSRVARAIRAGFSSGAVFLIKNPWGCTGFDAVIGRFRLRVRALFPLINEQTKLNANNVVSMADFRAQRLAA